MQVDAKKKRMSFSYNIGGERLKLIDISSEDDFLIASPLFDSLEDLRLSVTWDNSKENEGSKFSGIGTSTCVSAAEHLCQREQNMPSSSMESGRPSYLRKSLVWDKAFFTSDGVLDPDELSFINKGACLLPDTQQDVRARRPECSSDSDNCSVNSFSVSKEVGISSGNMIKSTAVSKGDPTNIQRSEKTKTKSLKPPKLSMTKMKNASSGQSKIAPMGTYHAKMHDSKTTTTTGQALLVPKKSAFGSSCSTARFPLSTVSSISTERASRPKVSSTLLKNGPGSRKNKLSTSISTSKTSLRYSQDSTKLKNLSFSTESFVPNQPQYKSSPANSTDDRALGASISTSSTNQILNGPDSQIDATVAFGGTSSLDGSPKGSQSRGLQSPCFISQETTETISTPSQFSEQALLGPGASSAASSGNSKPSCLRLPSPKIGFFDEVVPKARGLLKFQIGKASKSGVDEGKSAGASLKFQPAKTPRETGKLKQVSTAQPRSAGSFRLTNSSLFSGENKHGIHAGSELLAEKSAETDREICCKSRKVGSGEHGRRSVGVSPGLRGDKRKLKGTLKTKLSKESKGQREDTEVKSGAVKARNKRIGESSSTKQQVNDLSRCFELIDLWDDLKIDCKQEIRGQHPHSEKSPERHAEPASSSLAEEKTSPFCTSPEVVPVTRTPLADKTSLCNANVTVGSPVESKKGRSVEKAPAVLSSQGTDKENI